MFDLKVSPAGRVLLSANNRVKRSKSGILCNGDVVYICRVTMHYAKVVMGRWKQEFFNFERVIYLEYLDADELGGKVEKSI